MAYLFALCVIAALLVIIAVLLLTISDLIRNGVGENSAKSTILD